MTLTWPIDPPYMISYWCPIGTEPLSWTVFEICASRYICVTTLTFLVNVTSSVTRPIDPPYVISYWCLIGTEPLSSTVFEIFVSKYIWFTTLTFLGHVMSSVTWPIDPPYVISYWCPIVTKHLSLTVFEMFGPKTRALTHTHTHTRTHTHQNTQRNTPQVILYSVQCNVLHWTDNNLQQQYLTGVDDHWLFWVAFHSASVVLRPRAKVTIGCL